MHNIPKFPELPFLTRDMLKFGSKTALALRINARSAQDTPLVVSGFTRSGIIDIKFQSGTSADPFDQSFGLDDIPIMLSVVDRDNVLKPGECYVTVELLLNRDDSIGLCSGFVDMIKSISFPHQTMNDAIPGHGFFQEAASADAAAGAEAIITVPVGQIWRVLYGSVTLVTDANAADRRVHIVFTAPSSVILNTFSEDNIPNNTTKLISISANNNPSDQNNDNDLLLSMPGNIWLLPESTITTETLNKQAGDNYGVMTFMVETFFTNP